MECNYGKDCRYRWYGWSGNNDPWNAGHEVASNHYSIEELLDGVLAEFDAVVVIAIKKLNEIKDVTTEIQKISGVERTETMVEVYT